MPPLDTTQSASDEAADLRQALALLSPQEQAAILGGGVGDEASDELTVINELANNGDKEGRTITKDDLPEPKNEGTGDGNDLTNEDDDEDEEGDDEAARLTAEQQAVADAAAQLAQQQAAQADTAAQATFAEPAYVPVPPPVENYDERVNALHAERADANAKLLAGELSDTEMAAIDRKTLTELMSLSGQQSAHTNAVQTNEQIALNAWNHDVNTLKAIAKADGIDYDADPKMNASWDRWVKQLAEDPDNATQPANWFLKEAHRLTKLQYNRPDVEQGQSKESSAAQTKPPTKPAATSKNRAPDLSQIPPTLAHAPAAAIESDGDGGEFAYIDNLVGIERERALARLSEADAERYLAS